MWKDCVGRQKSKMVLLLAFVAWGCNNSSSSSKLPVGSKNANSAGKPCPKQLVGSQLSEPELEAPASLGLTSNLGKDPNFDINAQEWVKFIKNGGYLDSSFKGVPTQMKEFSDQGNTAGFVDVVDIPYCSEAAALPADSSSWIERCLNKRVQKILEDSAVRSEFLKKWQAPRLVAKRCTAHYSMDPRDLELAGNGTRLRIWTAEHCYQPAYTKSLTLQIYLPEKLANPVFKLNRGVYVPIALESDGESWRKKIIAVGGGGGQASDPRLAEKILILRSTDGRSSSSYIETVEQFCVGQDLPKLKGQNPKYVDCFSMTDVGTFKGTVPVNQPAVQGKYILETLPLAQLQEGRKVVLDWLRSESTKAKSSTGDSQLQGLFKGSGFEKHFSMTNMVLSIFDGLQHSRRVQALESELNGPVVSKMLGSSFSASNSTLNYDAVKSRLRPFQKYFSLVSNDFALDFGTPNSIPGTLAQMALCPFEGATGGLVNLIPGVNCASRVYQPPDSVALEELALKDEISTNLLDNLRQRLTVLVFKWVNGKLIGDAPGSNHPLRVQATDSVFEANLKFLSFQIKLWLDVMLLHKEPGGGVPLITEIAKIFQQVLVGSCQVLPQSQSWGGALFPIIGNIGSANEPLAFKKILPVKPGSVLNVMPIGIADASMYGGNSCYGNFLSPGGFGEVMEKQIGPKPTDIALMPADTVYGVRVDDSLVSPGPNADLKRYVSSRVVFKFEGAKGDAFQAAGPGDSGAILSWVGIPSFVLTSHNGVPVNGVVLAQLPELNEPVANPDNGSGGLCN